MEKISVDGSNFFILFYWDLKTEVFLKEPLAYGFSHWNRLPMCQTGSGIFGLKNKSL